jgi:DNA-binding transcriptional regulator YdaS (Cro superfamily)
MNQDTEEELVILEEGSDEEDADSTESSVLLIEAEGDDTFHVFGAGDLRASFVSDGNSTNDASRRGSNSAWQRMQSAVANQLGLSKRDLSAAMIKMPVVMIPPSRAPDLAPATSGGGSTRTEALSPTNLIATVSGGRRKRNERVISRRVVY